MVIEGDLSATIRNWMRGKRSRLLTVVEIGRRVLAGKKMRRVSSRMWTVVGEMGRRVLAGKRVRGVGSRMQTIIREIGWGVMRKRTRRVGSRVQIVRGRVRMMGWGVTGRLRGVGSRVWRGIGEWVRRSERVIFAVGTKRVLLSVA